MDAREDALVAISKVPANSGHSLHKGTPREAFIREFLEAHLPENVAIGTGEIIDSNSQPGEQRNQFDIVIYKKTYPKLDFGAGISGFLIESVIATVEVKSTLSEEGIKQSVHASVNAKNLTPNVITSFHAGYIPPKVLNFVIAYNGPAQMETVYNWIVNSHSSLDITTPELPQNEKDRLQTASPSLDGVFVLNNGFIYFDNVPAGFANAVRKENPGIKWVIGDTVSGNLLVFFLFLQTATANTEARWLNSIPYLSSFSALDLKFGGS